MAISGPGLGDEDGYKTKPKKKEEMEEYEDLAVRCIERCVRNKEHRHKIKQALGLAPYKGQGRSSDYESRYLKDGRNTQSGRKSRK